MEYHSDVKFPILNYPQLIDALRSLMYTSSVSQLESRVHAKGRVSCSVDVRELFAGGALAREWRTDLMERLQAVKVVGLGVRHSFQVWIAIDSCKSDNMLIVFRKKLHQARGRFSSEK